MEFTIETQYDHKAMKSLARGLRKTLRAKRSRRSHILGTLVIMLGIVLLIVKDDFDVQSLLTAAAIVLILYVFLREDDINGRVAKKRGLPGLNSSVTTFREEEYHSVTELGESTFSYEHILALAETKTYFLLIFSPNHGQVYAKEGIKNGSEAEFRTFLEQKTGLLFKTI